MIPYAAKLGLTVLAIVALASIAFGGQTATYQPAPLQSVLVQPAPAAQHAPAVYAPGQQFQTTETSSSIHQIPVEVQTQVHRTVSVPDVEVTGGGIPAAQVTTRAPSQACVSYSPSLGLTAKPSGLLGKRERTGIIARIRERLGR